MTGTELVVIVTTTSAPRTAASALDGGRDPDPKTAALLDGKCSSVGRVASEDAQLLYLEDARDCERLRGRLPAGPDHGHCRGTTWRERPYRDSGGRAGAIGPHGVGFDQGLEGPVER